MTRRNYTLQDRRRERIAAFTTIVLLIAITGLVVYVLVHLNEILVTF